MKAKISIVLISIGILFYCSCKQDTPSTNPEPTSTSSQTPDNKALWAEQVESSMNLLTPEGWTKDDFNMIFKGIDRKKIFQDITGEVLSGRRKSYDFFNDSALTIEQAKAIIEKPGNSNISLVRVREKVYFDKENFRLEREPNTLILYTSHYGEDSTFRGFSPLFYVKLNK